MENLKPNYWCTKEKKDQQIKEEKDAKKRQRDIKGKQTDFKKDCIDISDENRQI